ncbi:MAG: hypothetical protein LBD35_03980, partial [Prevotellaceae bacterium]|nr:hypothetical protein [Prevotellaceae bacterium]
MPKNMYASREFFRQTDVSRKYNPLNPQVFLYFTINKHIKGNIHHLFWCGTWTDESFPQQNR